MEIVVFRSGRGGSSLMFILRSSVDSSGMVMPDCGQGIETIESRLLAGIREGKSCKNVSHSAERVPNKGIRVANAAVKAAR